MSTYIVVIGDIVESKDLKPAQRKNTQNQLEDVFHQLNRQSRQLLSPYTITLGDEFQAVYRSADQLFHDIWAFTAEIHPVKVRVVISVGEITTEINREQSLGMDGPAFHAARDRIEEMKSNDTLLSLTTDDKSFDRLVNSSFRILGGNLRTWNKNRFTILKKRYENIEVKKIARDLNLSEVAVYKNIHAGTLDAVVDLTECISQNVNKMVTP
ncbi:SatD family protein [Rhodohalobacter sp.]|uniref:SatD family protein n=1 Tax=Rhodohalobacter sp. TaxID=1974210 RepID=UPI002ACD9700|nr:SatD family protein [Rhodohalobacter sp.]MDZ7756796.1 SatD family protein [Rhodohalobacter sp.]